MVKMMKSRAWSGLISTRINEPITHPTIGPNVGARFATPTTMDTSPAYGIPATFIKT